ncbi:MAG: ATP-binding protein [Candidatus Moranbacteria bacterium]|nr:ATP-binding protein [Candidatus Moranbacteria bacterium]
MKKLQGYDPGYSYKNVTSGARSSLSEKKLAELIVESVFKNRELTKKQRERQIGLREMSSGQRRSALLDYLLVIISSLESAQKSKIILGIDEPEISVGASARIQQFEKIARISNEIGGVVFTTHWYGWIQQLCNGAGIIIREDEDGRKVKQFSIEDSSGIDVSNPYEMRMMFDFLSSLGAWAENKPEMKFIICEGPTDFYLINKHFPVYKVIYTVGADQVISLYNTFNDYVLKTKHHEPKLKNVAFLIDTDPDKAKGYPERKYQNLMRISRNSNGKVEIVSENKNLAEKCTIEDALSPRPFLAALNGGMGELEIEDDKNFINGLSIRYPEETGIRAFGLDDVQRLKFKGIYSGEFKRKVAESYDPNEDERAIFCDLLKIF